MLRPFKNMTPPSVSAGEKNLTEMHVLYAPRGAGVFLHVVSEFRRLEPSQNFGDVRVRTERSEFPRGAARRNRANPTTGLPFAASWAR